MKRLIALLLCLVLALSAFVGCSSGDTEKPSSSKADSTNSKVEEPVEEIEIPYTPNPLTGFEKDSDYPDGQRPVAIMVNNISVCWPQSGISEADLIYEMVTEGGITRLMAVFNDYTKVPRTGPVRSARDQHVQLMFPYQAMYVHIGASVIAEGMLEQYEYSEQNLDGKYYAGLWWRDQTRLNQGFALEHTAFTDGEHIAATIEENNMDDDFEPKPIFNFVKYYDAPRELTGGDALSMRIVYSPNSYYYSGFSYDEATGKYFKTQAGEPHIDENTGEQLSFDNVFICFSDITNYPDTPLAKVDFSGQGIGYYFYGGKMEMVRWNKGLPEQPLYFTDGEGNETMVEVNCGKTYVGFSDYKNHDNFISSISVEDNTIREEDVDIDESANVDVAD